MKTSEQNDDATVIKADSDSLNDKTVVRKPVDDDETKIMPAVEASQDDETVVRLPEKPIEQGSANALTVNDETRVRDLADNDVTEVVSMREDESDDKPARFLQIGSILQRRFVIKEVMGSGGMGTVFRATDLRRQEAQDHQPDVAIKVLNDEFKDDPELFIALQRETKKTQLLAHPNIVTVYDFDRDGNHVFMVMQLLEGKPLSQYIRDEGKDGIPFKKAWPLIKGLALALAYAHKKNIIHSDFKPGNVFITSEGGVKVLDFGIACAAARSEAQSEDTVFNARDLGALTPAYASLEMFQGKEPAPSDDVYALACVSFEILTGKHPFGKLPASKALEVNLQVPPTPNLDRRQRNALVHALAFKREDRTPTIDAFFDEIEPQSIWPKVFGTLAITAVMGVAGSYYYFFQEFQFVDQEIIQLTPEQELKIKDFLELAQIHFEVGYLTAPSGSNAMWAYKQVLKIDPYNQEAQDGLRKIADVVMQEAVELFDRGNYKASLAKIEEGLEAVPKHESLLALKDQILKMNI